jgi:hypothetical protein
MLSALPTKGNYTLIISLSSPVHVRISHLGRFSFKKGYYAYTGSAVGNGADDGPMMEEAVLGLCVIGKEGASSRAVRNADVVFTDMGSGQKSLLKKLNGITPIIIDHHQPEKLEADPGFPEINAHLCGIDGSTDISASSTAYLVAQSVLIIGGNLRLFPLTGVTLPFVSSSTSSGINLEISTLNLSRFF